MGPGRGLLEAECGNHGGVIPVWGGITDSAADVASARGVVTRAAVITLVLCFVMCSRVYRLGF